MSDWWCDNIIHSDYLMISHFYEPWVLLHYFIYLLIIFQIFTSKPAKMLETIFRTCCDSKMLASINLNSITSHHRRRRGLISRTPWTFNSVFNLSMQCFILVIFLSVRNIIILFFKQVNDNYCSHIDTLLLCEYIINYVCSFSKIKEST